MPTLENWADQRLQDVELYPAGGWGPEVANALIAQEGHHWLRPTAVEERVWQHSAEQIDKRDDQPTVK